MIESYIPIVVFMVGLLTGAGIFFAGFKLGFRASYAIRAVQQEDGIEDHSILGTKKKDPAEFELLDREEPKNHGPGD